MFTRIQPAGNLFDYCESPWDYLGRARPVAPRRIKGDRQAVEELLLALAPQAVRPRRKPNAQRRSLRVKTGWVRHCQDHLVHLINCYLEPHARIVPHLPRILQGTEDLLLAGLPRTALEFVWYLHEKEYGTHPHGGLLRQILPAGPGYVPNLNPKLLLAFDRLVSRRFGLADPLDPAGLRLLYAAWASAKPANQSDIERVCTGVTECHARLGAAFGLPNVLQVCANLGLPVLAAPDAWGQPQLRRVPGIPNLPVPLRRQTVVVASFDRQRAICFAGPACRSDFSEAAYQQDRQIRQQRVADLRADPTGLYHVFQQLLAERIRQQQSWYGVQLSGVGHHHFAMLGEIVEAEILPVADWLAHLPPLTRWAERAYPFATEVDDLLADLAGPQSALVDVTDPAGLDLHEACEELLVRTAARPREREALAAQLGSTLLSGHLAAQAAGQEQQLNGSVQIALLISRRQENERARQSQNHTRLALQIALRVSRDHQTEQHHRLWGGRACAWEREALAAQLGCTLLSGHLAAQAAGQKQQLNAAVQIALRISQRQENETTRQTRHQIRFPLQIALRVSRDHQTEQQHRLRAGGRRACQVALRVGQQHELGEQRGRAQQHACIRELSLRVGQQWELEQEYMKIAATLAQLRQQRTEQQQQLAQLQAAAADRQARFGKNVQPFLDWAKQTNIPVAADFPLLAPTQQRHFLGTCVAVLHRELVQAQDEETRMRQMIAREQAALQEQEAQLTRQIEAADRAVAELELQLRQLETQLRAQQAGQKLRRQAAAERAEARKQASPTWSVRTQTAAENTADWKSCLRRAEDCQQELEHLLAARQKLATAQAHLDELEARIREREPETPQPQPPDLGDL